METWWHPPLKPPVVPVACGHVQPWCPSQILATRPFCQAAGLQHVANIFTAFFQYLDTYFCFQTYMFCISDHCVACRSVPDLLCLLSFFPLTADRAQTKAFQISGDGKILQPGRVSPWVLPANLARQPSTPAAAFTLVIHWQMCTEHSCTTSAQRIKEAEKLWREGIQKW
jgi:hypothetical protein